MQANEAVNGEEGSSKVEETSQGVENLTKSGEIGNESMRDSSSEAMGEVPSHQEVPEVNEETPETNYATPEANYEPPEDVHGIPETNQEVPEENQEWNSSTSNVEASSITEAKVETTTESGDQTGSTLDQMESIVKAAEKKKATIESVVQNVYEILKPTPSEFAEEETGSSGESKSATGVSVERMEEEDDENRWRKFSCRSNLMTWEGNKEPKELMTLLNNTLPLQVHTTRREGDASAKAEPNQLLEARQSTTEYHSSATR